MKDIEKYFRVYAEVNLDAIIKNMDMVMERYPLQKHLKMNALVMQ